MTSTKFLVAVLLAFLPAAALAASPFDGTWKARWDSLRVTGKPDAWAVVRGVYLCFSCTPQIRIRADGTEQKVPGHHDYDALAVRVLSAKSIEHDYKLAGRVVFSETLTVSSDGKTLSDRFVDNRGPKPSTGVFISRRVGAGPVGAHAVSGSWLQSALSGANNALTLTTYEMTADHLSAHEDGESYRARFDGKEYPIEGDSGHAVVTVRRIDDRTVIVTHRRGGRTTDVVRLSVAKDGRTMMLTDRDEIHGQVATFILDKQ